MPQTKDLFILLFLASCMLILSYYLFGWMYYQTDSPSYIEALKVMLGQAPIEADRLHRLVKPLALCLPYLFNKLFQIKLETGLLLQQAIAYFISSFFLFRIFELVFEQKGTAYLGTVLVLFCQPMAIYGLAIMTDGLGWMFEIMAIYFSILCIQNFQKQSQFAPIQLVPFCILGIVMGLGFFIKESILVAGLFAFILILISIKSWLSKFYLLMSIGFGFGIILLAMSLYTQYFFGKSMFTWWNFAHEDAVVAASFSLKNYLLQIYRSLDNYWYLVLIGCFLSLKNSFLGMMTKVEAAFILTGLIGLIIFPFLWDYQSDRILFMFSWLLLIPAARYLERWSWSSSFLLVILSGVLQLWATYRIYQFQEKGWLLATAICFLALFFMMEIYHRLQSKL